MKKTNNLEEYEQLTIDLGDETITVEAMDEQVESKKTKKKELRAGAKITVKPETKKFCDGRGIPDYARTAYVKRINATNTIVVIESEPNGKEFGTLFASDIIVV